MEKSKPIIFLKVVSSMATKRGRTTATLYLPVSFGKLLDKIRPRKQNRDCAASSKLRKIVAIDTETDGNGNIFLIADSYGQKILDHPDITFEKVAQFLLRYDEGYWVFFYNLSFDADCILKLIPKEVLKKQYTRGGELKFEYNGYTVHYIEKKQLSLRKGRHTVTCYDIAQYYDNEKLDSAYEKNIGKPLDPQYLAVKEERKNFSLRYFERNKKAIREYCINDCILTKELAENFVQTFLKQFGFVPRRWTSSGYLAEKVLINNGISIPYFHDLPYEVQELAWKSFYGGRFELIQRGYIGECWLYDINSAYPHALTLLPDLTMGRWVSLDKIHQQAAVGFFHIQVHVDNCVKIAPFPFRTKDSRIIYPVGDFETFVTLEELKAVKGDTRISYEILDSLQFIPDKDCTYPFKKFIEDQYYLRLRLKKNKDPLERAIKVVLNSIYGKTAQRINNVMGNIYNAAIAAYITGYARAQLYLFVREHGIERDTVAFATDSVAVRKEIAGLDSERLGEMKLDKQGDDVIYLSNGFYQFNGKWKQRGVGYDREKKVEINHKDTRVGEDGQLYILVETTRTTHIKSGIVFNKLRTVGKIEQYEKKIGLNSDRKRMWIDEMQSLKETKLCDSMPININLVADIIAKKSDMEWEDEQEEGYEPESDL
jgi:hypothetical protein